MRMKIGSYKKNPYMTHFLSHRGESDDAPENTLAAFRLAVERDSDGIELDLRLTADDELVCVHDTDLARVAGVEVTVASATLAELRRFHPVPRLSEILSLLTPAMRLQIELKGSDLRLPGRLAKVLDVWDGDRSQLAISSFEREIIMAAADFLPDMPRLLLSVLEEADGCSPAPEKIAADLRSLCCTGISFRASSAADAGFVQKLYDFGFQVNCWGIASDELGLQMASCGVDTMTCNHAVALRRQWRDVCQSTGKGENDTV